MVDSEGSTGVVMGKMYASKVFETGLNVPWMYNLKPKNVRKICRSHIRYQFKIGSKNRSKHNMESFDCC